MPNMCGERGGASALDAASTRRGPCAAAVPAGRVVAGIRQAFTAGSDAAARRVLGGREQGVSPRVLLPEPMATASSLTGLAAGT